MIARVEGRDIGGPRAAYANADALIADLADRAARWRRRISAALAANLVKPVRREVETFRFTTVRLDVRENTTKLNAALHAL